MEALKIKTTAQNKDVKLFYHFLLVKIVTSVTFT